MKPYLIFFIIVISTMLWLFSFAETDKKPANNMTTGTVGSFKEILLKRSSDSTLSSTDSSTSATNDSASLPDTVSDTTYYKEIPGWVNHVFYLSCDSLSTLPYLHEILNSEPIFKPIYEKKTDSGVDFFKGNIYGGIRWLNQEQDFSSASSQVTPLESTTGNPFILIWKTPYDREKLGRYYHSREFSDPVSTQMHETLEVPVFRLSLSNPFFIVLLRDQITLIRSEQWKDILLFNTEGDFGNLEMNSTLLPIVRQLSSYQVFHTAVEWTYTVQAHLIGWILDILRYESPLLQHALAEELKQLPIFKQPLVIAIGIGVKNAEAQYTVSLTIHTRSDRYREVIEANLNFLIERYQKMQSVYQSYLSEGISLPPTLFDLLLHLSPEPSDDPCILNYSARLTKEAMNTYMELVFKSTWQRF